MTNKEIRFLVDELLLKLKFLSDALNDKEESRNVGGLIGIVDTSSVLFEVEEGMSVSISRMEDENDED